MPVARLVGMKLAAVIGAVLIALGAGVAWVALSGDDADRRVGALGGDEALTEGPRGAFQWRGEFSKEAAYQAMDVVSFDGSSYVAKTETKEIAPPDEPWDVLARAGAQGAAGDVGAQGPAGTFTGTFQSPDGKYKLSVTNAGIDARGPNGWVTIDSGGTAVRSGTNLVVDAGSTLELKASATAILRGATVSVGCASGGKPVARLGDPLAISATSGGAGAPVTFQQAQISQGSSTVLAC